MRVTPFVIFVTMKTKLAINLYIRVDIGNNTISNADLILDDIRSNEPNSSNNAASRPNTKYRTF